MKDVKSIDTQLSIVIKEGNVMADVIFTNNLSEKVYLDKWTICTDDVFRGNIFSIVDENNKHVMYSGMLVNRKIVPELFISLNPGESIQTHITVNKGYELTKGNKYSVKFCAINPTFREGQPRIDLMSNKVEITY